MVTLDSIASFLNHFFDSQRFGDDQSGVFVPSQRPVRRLGLALEPWPRLDAWARQAQLDALFLHRPWTIIERRLDPDIGVLAYHLAFDECLTLGYNPRLAAALTMTNLAVLGKRSGRPLGMIGDVPSQDFAQYRTHATEVFGGNETVLSGDAPLVERVAVVGAMTDVLVREAVTRGAAIYITGQLRQPARAAVDDTGIAVIEVGHRRSEVWGLRALAGVLRERWTGLTVVLPPRL